ncbi:hypothetical protein [Pluralibacter sp.]|uniref:hypothetical protein n=1 Tax=Pluralibacter sp. TaxID=1920032 RepID=UPI0025D52360|nr:hypothetical protein [Pluralibacter sp.]MBV8045191.1 hypothetical protein [Pluralibacter sp.]
MAHHNPGVSAVQIEGGIPPWLFVLLIYRWLAFYASHLRRLVRAVVIAVVAAVRDAPEV